MADHDELTQRALQAWADFCDGLKSLGATIVADGMPRDDVERAEGFRFITHVLRNNLERHLECADPDFPVFFRQSHDTQRLGNADNHYLMATVRGDREYLIRGRRNTAHHLQFTAYSAPGPNGSECIGMLDAEHMRIDADGAFEIRVSSTRSEGNWLPLRSDAQMVQVRNTFLDRAKEIPADVTITTLDVTGAPPPLTGAQFESRLRTVLKGTQRFVTLRSGWYKLFRASGWINTFGDSQHIWQTLAAVPNMHYLQGCWELAEDEALVIESDAPPCTNWVLQVNNCFMEAHDYRYHQVMLTRHRAQVDADGRLRIVLAARDPGVPNWLETAGHAEGTMVWRWLSPERKPVVNTRVIKLTSL